MPAKVRRSWICASSISRILPRLMWPGSSTEPERTRGMVVEQHARHRLAVAQVQQLPVELHLVAGPHRVAQLRDMAVDGDVALRDEDLDVAPRAVARLRHDFLQPLALRGAAAALALALALAAPLVEVLLRLGPFRHDAAGPFQLVLGVWSIPHGSAPWSRGVGSAHSNLLGPILLPAAGRPLPARRGWGAARGRPAARRAAEAPRATSH